MLLVDLQDYEGAKQFMEKAMKSNIQNFGNNHPQTAASYSNLATVIFKQGDYEGAKKLIEKAIKIYESINENHPITAQFYGSLAYVLMKLKDRENALFFSKKAYKIFLEKLGKDHPSTKNIKELISKFT